MTTRVAYLGPAGTYTHQAARHFSQALPGGRPELKPYPGIPSVLYAVDQGQADLGVVPVENSIEGSVSITHDILAQSLALTIQGETVLPIVHHLYSSAAALGDIRTVVGHYQALAQCRLFLEQNLSRAKTREASSSAAAVSSLKKAGGSRAAIGTPECRELYQVPVLAENIGDYPDNQTRFFLVGKGPSLPEYPAARMKTALVLTLRKDKPGGLYSILGEFARRRLNLTRIESRPAKQELGNYLFFLDCETTGEDPAFQSALSGLAKKKVLVKILGTYPVLDGPAR